MSASRYEDTPFFPFARLTEANPVFGQELCIVRIELNRLGADLQRGCDFLVEKERHHQRLLGARIPRIEFRRRASQLPRRGRAAAEWSSENGSENRRDT